ncbi:hypothetical protein Hanom_Chr07g00629081 [Helianthus anomalus]
MVKAWWIRRWYFLYISVFTMLPNFRKTCHEKFGVLQTIFRPKMQNLNTQYPIIHDETSFLTQRVRLSNTHAIPILIFVY